MDNYIYNCFDKTIYDYLNENLNDINISFIKIKDLSIIKNKDDLIYNENGEKIETFIEEFKNNNKNDIDNKLFNILSNYLTSSNQKKLFILFKLIHNEHLFKSKINELEKIINLYNYDINKSFKLKYDEQEIINNSIKSLTNNLNNQLVEQSNSIKSLNNQLIEQSNSIKSLNNQLVEQSNSIKSLTNNFNLNNFIYYLFTFIFYSYLLKNDFI